MHLPSLKQQLPVLELTNFVQLLPSCDIILAASKSEKKQLKSSTSSSPPSTEHDSDFSSNMSGSFEDNGDDS